MHQSLYQALALSALLGLIPRLAQAQATVTVDGTARLAPITQEVARIYHDLIKGTANVTINVSSTASGLKRFCHGDLDVSGAIRPMLRAELELCQHNGVEFYEVPIAYDVLAIIVNKQNYWSASIAVDDLSQLWSHSGKDLIGRWNQLRPQWPRYSIRLFSSPSDSETFEFFGEAIHRSAKALRSDVNHLRSSSEIIQAVSGNPSAIGYCPISECGKKTAGIKILPVDFGRGPVLPSAATVQNNSYPRLSRPLFLYVNRKSTEQIAGHRFVALYLLRASQAVGLAGYLPLEDRTYKIAVNVMKNKRVGSVYGGGPHVDLTVDPFVKAHASLR